MGDVVFMPIADTFSGTSARDRPSQAIEHYTRLAERLWLSPLVRESMDGVLASVGEGRVAWGSLVGPYGFGKTATATMLWSHATDQGFLAIPPLSCTSFDELAHGISALAQEQAPRHAPAIRKLFKKVWAENVAEMAARDVERYDVDAPTMRRILQGKLSSGELALDGQCHRLVQFLSELGHMARGWSRGLVVVLDELQQLLGPLDARAITTFREFVWGIRTEKAPCGVLLCMDSLLEARLGKWAADLLHRIREHGPVLQLTHVYTRDFPRWLWQQANNDAAAQIEASDENWISQDVLLSLGQFVERPDLASGPRTVVDVFTRAVRHAALHHRPYDIKELVDDLHDGHLRYFGEGAPVQRLLLDLLADPWLQEDPARAEMVRLLVAFPSGCPDEVVCKYFPDENHRQRLRAEMFAPLLIASPSGEMALEGLQRVRRRGARWEEIMARGFDSLPALDVLASHAPSMIRRILLPRLFPPGVPTSPKWQTLSDSARSGDGWTRLRGTFADAFPQREVGLWVEAQEPESWPEDLDVCLAFVCLPQVLEGEPSLELDGQRGRITLRLPVLRAPSGFLPPELEQFRKHVEPEPLRPATVLSALHDLVALVTGSEGMGEDDGEDAFKMDHARAFVEATTDYLLSQLLQGNLDAGPRALQLRGPEVLRAAFYQVCRTRFNTYQTLQATPNWRPQVLAYAQALARPLLNEEQRHGTVPIEGAKAEVVRDLFNMNSTAAFDSYAKSLGALLETGGDAARWQVTLRLHPAETVLMTYVRESGAKHGIPDHAAHEHLRHQGYLQEETEQIIALLEARNVLARRANGNLTVAPRAHAVRAQLLADVQCAEHALRRCGVAPDAEADAGDDVASLRARLQEAQERLRLGVQNHRTEAAALNAEVFNCLGRVRERDVPTELPEGDFQTHLAGVARTLSASRDSVLDEGRKLSGRIQVLGEPRSPDDVLWAESWHRARGALTQARQRLEERDQEFAERHLGLIQWCDTLAQEHAVRVRAERLRHDHPSPARQLDALAAQWSQKFALEGYVPLLDAGSFQKRLALIEADLQSLRFSQVESYLRETALLRQRFNELLRGNAPLLEAAWGEDGALEVAPPFEALYAWALDSFVCAAHDCRRAFESGVRWRHPTNSKKKWPQQSEEFEDALAHARQTPSLDVVMRVGELVQAMSSGLQTSNLLNQATPLPTPVLGTHEPGRDQVDFELLRQCYESGQIRIRVEEPGNTRDGTA
jgi:hypothetical protein